MVEPWLQFDDFEEESVVFGTESDEPRLFYNKTTFSFSYPARFNKTSVALLSGAILFLIVNTSFLLMYLYSKRSPPTKSSKEPYEGSDSSQDKNNEEKNIYENYYEYYYEHIYDEDPNRLDENPRYVFLQFNNLSNRT